MGSGFMVDLHLHSRYSDGELSVKELLDEIFDTGVDLFSITDHDNVSSCFEMEKYLLPDDCMYIPGIEFSAYCGKYHCHILGYDFDYRNSRLIKECETIRKRKLEKIKIVINLLRVFHQIDITKDEELSILKKKGTIGRIDVCKLLMKKGYGSRREIYDKYLSIPNTLNHRSDAAIITNIVDSAGGVSILAHPGEIERDYNVCIEDIIENFLDVGINGIEAYNSIHSLRDVKRYLLLAKKYNLLVTAGSDFHGSIKPERILGYTTTSHIPIKKKNINFHSKGIIY